MPQFRVAVERTYFDVSIQFVDAETAAAAKEIALSEALETPPSDWGEGAVGGNVIECNQEPDVKLPS